MENHCFRNFAQDTGPRVQCTELQAMSVLTGLCDQETLHCLCHEGREARTRPPRGSNAPYVKVKEQLHAIARTPAGGTFPVTAPGSAHVQADVAHLEHGTHAAASQAWGSLWRASRQWLRSYRHPGNGEGGREGAESRASAQDSQSSLGGHIHEWRGVGGTHEDEIMNGCPRMST